MNSQLKQREGVELNEDEGENEPTEEKPGGVVLGNEAFL